MITTHTIIVTVQTVFTQPVNWTFGSAPMAMGRKLSRTLRNPA
jgi:hypothetical protein